MDLLTAVPAALTEAELNSRRDALTFSGCVEAYTNGEQHFAEDIGKTRAFTYNEVIAAAAELQARGVEANVYVLSASLPSEAEREENPACVLHLPGAVDRMVTGGADALFREQTGVEYDKKFFDRGKTKNKLARHNIVFGDTPITHSEDYKQSTMRTFAELPRLAEARAALGDMFGPRAEGLLAEGNRYYDRGSGIGLHGDGERPMVLCVSVGAPMVLRYFWRAPKAYGQKAHVPYGPPMDLRIGHGDVYLMSEKATGTDWKHISKHRLVHGAARIRADGEGVEAKGHNYVNPRKGGARVFPTLANGEMVDAPRKGVPYVVAPAFAHHARVPSPSGPSVGSSSTSVSPSPSPSPSPCPSPLARSDATAMERLRGGFSAMDEADEAAVLASMAACLEHAVGPAKYGVRMGLWGFAQEARSAVLRKEARAMLRA